MTYAVFFKWLDDGTEDTFNVKGIKELKLNIQYLKDTGKEIIDIQKVLRDGERIPYKLK